MLFARYVLGFLSGPDSGTLLHLEISFTNEYEELLVHMNFDLRVIQDEDEIFIMENIHSVDGIGEYLIPVESDNPIDIKIGIRGIYPDFKTPQPVEEVLEFQSARIWCNSDVSISWKFSNHNSSKN